MTPRLLQRHHVHAHSEAPLRIPWLKLIGAFVVGWIIYNLDVRMFLSTFSEVDITSLLLSFTFLLLFILLKCLRWRSLLVIQQIAFPLLRAVNVYIAAQFLALVTPGKIGDFVKVFYLEKDAGVSHFRAATSVIADRLFDLGMLVLVAFAGLYSGIIPPAYERTCQIFGIIVLVLLVLLLHRPSMALVYKAATRLPLIGRKMARLNALLKEMYSSFEEFKTPGTVLPLAISILAYLALFLHAFYLAQGLLIPVSLLQITFIVVIGNIASLIPISIGGIGPREAVIQALFVQLLGNAQVLTPTLVARLEAEGLAFSLSYYGIFLLTTGVIGGIAWLRNPVSIDSVRRLAAELRK